MPTSSRQLDAAYTHESNMCSNCGNGFFRALLCISAAFAVVQCLSVWVSVMFVYYIDTSKHEASRDLSATAMLLICSVLKCTTECLVCSDYFCTDDVLHFVVISRRCVLYIKLMNTKSLLLLVQRICAIHRHNSPHDVFYRMSVIAILSVCPSVRPSVRHVPVFYRNGLTYCQSFFTTR